jgi:hypothetical protein
MEVSVGATGSRTPHLELDEVEIFEVILELISAGYAFPSYEVLPGEARCKPNQATPRPLDPAIVSAAITHWPWCVVS